MYLSILIPVYKWDCRQLVADLDRQAKATGISYEILQADDEQLRLGRARIRNHLAAQAQGEWLLFIDCDAAVESDTYLRTYLDAVRSSGAQVVCGGLHHDRRQPSPEVSLRWRYEHRADRRRAARYRAQHPCQQFTPFNFLIRRELFLSLRFDERIESYGHEDTLFGRELARRGITPLHIDNPLVHKGLEPNALFLEKTRTALCGLHRFHDGLDGYSPLLRASQLLERLHLCGVVRRLFVRCRGSMERNLLGPHPSLFLFKLYKLGYYTTL